MKYFIPVFSILFIFVSSIFSCKKEQSQAVDMGYSYFPDQVGHFVVYDVDSFYYNDFTDHIDTFKFQLKEKIESAFPDNQNRRTLRIERYVKFYDPVKPYSTIPWKLRNVWVANRTDRTAERVEENIRINKLIFPVSSKSSWNGNSQNTLPPVNYSYLFVDLPRTIGKIAFDSVLQVNQQDETNLISKKFYIEKYARNIGLTYKHVIDVQSQPDGVPDSLLPVWIATPIMERVDAGIQYIVTINSYGNE
ncbi:MAG TPA: hypothetical protein VLB84_10340 [Bacteroidia bacterium]|nr:hypothetical protein [Bacteroidia bacterium]